MAASHSASDVRTRFLHKLDEVQSNADVKSLLSECPVPTDAGYRFYSDFAFFIEHLVPPRTADISETQHYIKLSERLRYRGGREKDSRAQAVTAFKAANAARR
jgi:hypothetical protein